MNWLFGLFKMRFIHSLQYRSEAWAGFATQIGFGIMNVVLFTVLYNSNPGAFPMSLEQTASFLWMQQGLLSLVNIGYGDRDTAEIAGTIETGAVAYELVRPADLFNRWVCQMAANRCSGALLRIVPLFIVASLIPKPYGLSLPANVTDALLFLFSTALSLGVTITINMLICVSTFVTMAHTGVRGVVASVSEFLSGLYVPLLFFPQPFRAIAELLPFGSMQNAPLRFYTGVYGGAGELARVIALQIFWVAVLWAFGRFSMNRVLKKVTVQGG